MAVSVSSAVGPAARVTRPSNCRAYSMRERRKCVNPVGRVCLAEFARSHRRRTFAELAYFGQGNRDLCSRWTSLPTYKQVRAY